jgi:hypothetical protein
VRADENLTAFVELEMACSQQVHRLKVPPRNEVDVGQTHINKKELRNKRRSVKTYENK